MNPYLKASDVIDWKNSQILALAKKLSDRAPGKLSTAQRIFEWVRDNIQHSTDFNWCEVTCCASEVLAVGTGFCYAKSHLVAALMRACQIPTGFCYQRRSVTGTGAPFCLHGLNAIYLNEHGWYRIDARGDNDSVQTVFTPPMESLAFRISVRGEADLPEIWPDPLPVVVEALNAAQSVEELKNNLPDVPLIGSV